MAQAATPGELGLPCSPKQALALYKHLFWCPAGLGQLRAALRQVREARPCLQAGRLSMGPDSSLPPRAHERWACPWGLELPTLLLEMERSRRAQEQLLWDLELLTGAGLGLFWPPRVQFCGLRDQAQCAWSQRNKPRSRTGRGSEQLTSGSSRLCSSPQAGDCLSQNHPAGGQAADPSSAPDLDKARSETDPRWESFGRSAEPTPGCLQELNPATSSSFGEPGSSEFKELDQKEKRGRAEPTTQRPLRPSSGSLQGRKVTQEAPGLSGLPSQGLPEPQGPPKGLGWSLGQDRADLQKLLRIEIPQGQREKTNQGQSGEATRPLREEVSGGPGWETSQGENKDALQGQRGNRPERQRKEVLLGPRKETPQGEEVKILQSSGGGGRTSQAWEVAQGEAPTQPQEEGDSLGTPGDFCRSLGEQVPQPGRRESPGPSGRSTQLIQDKNDGQRPESALALGEHGTGLQEAPAPLPSPRPPAALLLPGPGAVMLAPPSTGASGQQERPTGLPGHPGMVRNRHGLQDSGAGPGPAEQQVLERLRIARNRHCQVHPLAPPPSPAQLPSQEDAAQQRRALREQLEHVHRERTGRLRALRARNTQNFQQLLWPPGAEEPAPGE
ncbi:uncharacterized protein LOC109457215 isoform X2 [Rhinolophus sinicus]|uniref:uncharacterized protein LOC109457215 isoform X2 n=1 Tax=Rhinolophus sinicus TaxID=89399 RepID=UPI003D7BADAF